MPLTRGFWTLPDELLVHVFAHLEPDNLGVCAAVCRRWLRIVTDDSSWREAFLKFFGVVQTPVPRIQDCWRDEYMHRCIIVRALHRSNGPSVLFSTAARHVLGHPIAVFHVDWDWGRVWVGSAAKGYLVSCDYRTGKMSKDVVYCGPANEPRRCSYILVESYRIAAATWHGQIFIVTHFRSNAFSRHIKSLTPRGNSLPTNHPLAQHDGPVLVMQWVPHTSYLISVGTKNVIVDSHNLPLYSESGMTPSSNNSQITSRVKVWDTSITSQPLTSCCILLLNGNDQPVLDLALSQRHYTLTLTSTHINIYTILYNSLSNQLNTTTFTPAFVNPTRIIPIESLHISKIYYNCHSHPICFAWNTQSTELPSPTTTSSSLIHVFDLNSGQLLGILKAHLSRITSLTILLVTKSTSTTSSSLPQLICVSGDYNGTIALWHISPRMFLDRDTSNHNHVLWSQPITLLPTMLLTGHTASITSLHLDPVKIVSGSSDGWIRIWDTLSGKLIRRHFCSATRSNNPIITESQTQGVDHLSATMYQVVAALQNGQIKSLNFEPIQKDRFGARALKRSKRRQNDLVRGNNNNTRGTGRGNNNNNNSSSSTVNGRRVPFYRASKADEEIRQATKELKEEAKERERWMNVTSKANGDIGLTEDELMQLAMHMSLEGDLTEESEQAQIDQALAWSLADLTTDIPFDNEVDNGSSTLFNHSTTQPIDVSSETHFPTLSSTSLTPSFSSSLSATTPPLRFSRAHSWSTISSLPNLSTQRPPQSSSSTTQLSSDTHTTPDN